MKHLVILGTLITAAILPASAQTNPMEAMQYYVGTWSCDVTPPGKPTQHATATHTLDDGVLREWINMPAQGSMKKPFVFSAAITYDAKHHRYVQSYLDNDAGWEISVAKPFTGNVEEWTDLATDSGNLSHTEVKRTNTNSFSIVIYDAKTGGKPVLHVTCRR